MKRYNVTIGDITLSKVEGLLAWVNHNGGSLVNLSEQSVTNKKSPSRAAYTRTVLDVDAIHKVIDFLSISSTVADRKKAAEKFNVSLLTIDRINRREGRYKTFK